MTSMTMAGGGIGPHPKWKLGEIGAVIHEKMNQKIDNLDQLNLYMQRNDADLVYGSRILAQIEAILKDVRTSGLSKDVAVAVESTRPGTIPPNIQRILTSNYSRTHQKETMVALESWASIGRFGLIVMLLTAVVKIVSWIVSSGKAFGGAGSKNSPEDYVTKVNEKGTDGLPEGSIYDSLKVTAVKDAYLAVIKDAGKNKDKLNLSVAMVDTMLSDLKGEVYLNTLGAALGRSPFLNLFKAYAEKPSTSEADVTFDIIDTLLSYNVTSAIFKAKSAANAWQILPKGVRDAGIHYPNEDAYLRYMNMVDELGKYYNHLSAGFAELSDFNLYREFKKDDAIKTSGNRKVFAAGEGAIMGLVTALRAMNNVTAVGIDDCSRGFAPDNAPVVIVDPRQASHLVGYDEGIEIPQGKVVKTAQEASFLTRSTLQLLRDKSHLNNSDARSILQSILSLTDAGYTDKTFSGRLNQYSKLESCLKSAADVIEKWSKDVKKNDADYFKFLSDAIVRELEGKTGDLGSGRELSLMFFSGGEDFFVGLRNNINLTRRLCMGAVSLQTVINSSERNPLVKK